MIRLNSMIYGYVRMMKNLRTYEIDLTKVESRIKRDQKSISQKNNKNKTRSASFSEVMPMH